MTRPATTAGIAVRFPNGTTAVTVRRCVNIANAWHCKVVNPRTGSHHKKKDYQIWIEPEASSE